VRLNSKDQFEGVERVVKSGVNGRVVATGMNEKVITTGVNGSRINNWSEWIVAILIAI